MLRSVRVIVLMGTQGIALSGVLSFCCEGCASYCSWGGHEILF